MIPKHKIYVNLTSRRTSPPDLLIRPAPAAFRFFSAYRAEHRQREAYKKPLRKVRRGQLQQIFKIPGWILSERPPQKPEYQESFRVRRGGRPSAERWAMIIPL